MRPLAPLRWPDGDGRWETSSVGDAAAHLLRAQLLVSAALRHLVLAIPPHSNRLLRAGATRPGRWSGRAPAVDLDRRLTRWQPTPARCTYGTRDITTYRCSLPGLTGFMASRRAGPDHHHHLPEAVPRVPGPRAGIRPRYSGLRVQGTASSPPSTTVGHRITSARGPVKEMCSPGEPAAPAALRICAGHQLTIIARSHR